jgi:O-methyltransferase
MSGGRSPRPAPPCSGMLVSDQIALARSLLRSMLLRLDNRLLIPDRGNCVIYGLPGDIPAAEEFFSGLGSGARLFEEGVELGPGSAIHDDIRNLGRGRFSYWKKSLFFSSRDNSSPLKNNRQYHLLLPARIFAPNAAYAPSIEGIESRGMPLMERLMFARALYRSVWPNVVFSDKDRRIDNDGEFAREFERLSPEADFTLERKYNLNQLFQLVLHLRGDVVECGVYKGASAFFMARHIIERRLPKKLCLFDSFEGLSSPGDRDGDYWCPRALAGTPEDVWRSFAPLGQTGFVELFKGWIPERFSEVSRRSFCFLHLDVDLYQPTLDSIEFFYPRMVPGGIILLDDYGFLNCPGVTEAIDAFMADKPEPIINLASGGAFIMKTSTS